MTYMANLLGSKEEREELLTAFQALDEDGNGILTKQELVKGNILLE
jgi:Ca2+-binding EF-hand superfamily protein